MTTRTPIIRRAVLRLATGLAVIATVGCTPVFPGRGKAPKLYTLTPKSTFRKDLPQVDWQLVVEVPFTTESLDTARIALSRSPLLIEYYKDVRWSERMPVMVQTLLVESFENTGKIVAVARQSTDLRADYVLKPDLREFQAEYDGNGPPTVRVRISAKLVKMPERAIIASHSVERVQRAHGTDVADVAAAFDQALGKVLKSVVEWALLAP
ncbi:MAG: ABC-type transport auxiliary lipoprotein family protein [Alphaproteobacteria bacterium]